MRPCGEAAHYTSSISRMAGVSIMRAVQDYSALSGAALQVGTAGGAACLDYALEPCALEPWRRILQRSTAPPPWVPGGSDQVGESARFTRPRRVFFEKMGGCEGQTHVVRRGVCGGGFELPKKHGRYLDYGSPCSGPTKRQCAPMTARPLAHFKHTQSH